MPWFAAAIPFIAMGVSAVGAGVSAYSQVKQGEAQADALDYNRKVAMNEATAARAKAAFDEDQNRRKMQRLMSIQRAGYAKAGVDVGSGSPLDVLLQQAKDAEMDALTIRYTGDVQAGRYMSQAGLLDMQAGDVKEAAIIGATSTLLQGAGNAASSYYTGKTRGIGMKGTGNA